MTQDNPLGRLSKLDHSTEEERRRRKWRRWNCCLRQHLSDFTSFQFGILFVVEWASF